MKVDKEIEVARFTKRFIGADLYGPVGLEPPLIIIRWAQQCIGPPLIFSREKNSGSSGGSRPAI